MANQSKIPNKKGRYIVNEYTVVEFDDGDSDERLFECIPNSWFVDENKTSCYWPPKCGLKSVMQRAINCEKPADTWNIYVCVVVSTGHLSYAAGYKVLREKCSQKYNTSSAEERENASNFRRQHPVLALQQGTSFEQVFSKPNASVDVHQSENIETMNTTDDMSTEQVEDEIQHFVSIRSAPSVTDLNAKESREPSEPQHRSSAKKPVKRTEHRSRSWSNSRKQSTAMKSVNRTKASTSKNINERRISRSRSDSRERSTAMKSVGTTKASTSKKMNERRISRSRSGSRNRSTAKKRIISTSDRSSSHSDRSQSSFSSTRSQQSRDRRAYRSTSRRSESAIRILHSRSRSLRRSRSSIQSNSGRSGSRSAARDSRSHSSFRGSEPVNASRTGINYLIILVEKIGQRQVEHDRRLNRMEVSINKALILVGDLSNTNNSLANSGLNNRDMDEESDMEINEFEVPKIPIQNLSELFTVQKQLKNRRFKRFLIKHERDFCTPSKIGTHTVTLTKYLKRFISLDLRCKFTLKEKTESGYTLMDDFHRVYTYLIELMRAGYQNGNKILTVDEAHTAIGTVWGRSKQQKNEQEQKKIKQKRRDDKKKKAHGHRRHQ